MSEGDVLVLIVNKFLHIIVTYFFAIWTAAVDAILNDGFSDEPTTCTSHVEAPTTRSKSSQDGVLATGWVSSTLSFDEVPAAATSKVAPLRIGSPTAASKDVQVSERNLDDLIPLGVSDPEKFYENLLEVAMFDPHVTDNPNLDLTPNSVHEYFISLLRANYEVPKSAKDQPHRLPLFVNEKGPRVTKEDACRKFVVLPHGWKDGLGNVLNVNSLSIYFLNSLSIYLLNSLSLSIYFLNSL